MERGMSGLSLAPARMWKPYGRIWLSLTALPQTMVRWPMVPLLCLARLVPSSTCGVALARKRSQVRTLGFIRMVSGAGGVAKVVKCLPNECVNL
jgi:hypothetical protein